MKIFKQILIILGVGALLSGSITILTSNLTTNYRFLDILIITSCFLINIILVFVLIRLIGKLFNELDNF